VVARRARRAQARPAQLAELIEANAEELALTETLDMGKPIRDSQRIDIPATARCFRWYGEAIDKVYDEVAPTAATRSRSSRASRWASSAPSCRGTSRSSWRRGSSRRRSSRATASC
jgi:acyl-CoA reductase-like NAD-dependent aldehyde dehydrogenase